MSIGLISKFINSEILKKGGEAEPLDVTIGKKGDVASSNESSSLMSWVKSIFNTVKNTNLGTSGDTANYNGATLWSRLNYMINAIRLGGMPIVKNVQRGVASFSASGSVTVSISSINPSKAIVILDGNSYDQYSVVVQSNPFMEGNFRYTTIPYCSSLSATSLRIDLVRTTGAYVMGVAWQVIEFY